MAKDDQGRGAEAAARQRPFTFYAAQGRIYVRNGAQKLIDLGALTQSDGGIGYTLDGNDMTGSGFRTQEAALRDIAKKVRFLWLDGQFTAVADARDHPDLDLDGATQIDVTLDELPPDERMFDATV